MKQFDRQTHDSYVSGLRKLGHYRNFGPGYRPWGWPPHSSSQVPAHEGHFRACSQALVFDAPRALCYLSSGQFNAKHSSVAQWQSIRLLTEGL